MTDHDLTAAARRYVYAPPKDVDPAAEHKALLDDLTALAQTWDRGGPGSALNHADAVRSLITKHQPREQIGEPVTVKYLMSEIGRLYDRIEGSRSREVSLTRERDAWQGQSIRQLRAFAMLAERVTVHGTDEDRDVLAEIVAWSPDQGFTVESLVRSEALISALFDLADKYDVPLTNNGARVQDGQQLREVGDFVGDIITAVMGAIAGTLPGSVEGFTR